MKKVLFFALFCTTLLSALVLNNTSAITVSSAGTAVQFSTTPINCTNLFIQARAGNSGLIYIGGSTVSASNKFGYSLAAGVGVNFAPVTTKTLYYNVSDFWVDAVSSNDGLTWTCVR